MNKIEGGTMEVNEILEVFSNPETIHTLTAGQKSIGVGFTLVLGMGITFTSLIILKIVIDIMGKLTAQPKATPTTTTTAKVSKKVAKKTSQDDQAFIAAITVALATKLGTSADNIKITNIKKKNDITSLLEY